MYSILNLISSSAVSSGSRYYYSRLTNDQKRVYNAILSGVKAHAKNIKMPQRPINEISKIFNYVLLDHPILFYVSSGFQQSSDLYKKKCIIIPDYRHTRSDVWSCTNSVMKCLRELDSAKDKSDIDKELYVHDYCLNNFSYDYAQGEYSHSILGLVHNRKAVCEGIAKFVKLAFDYLGVKSLVVSGKANNPALDSRMEGHAWNIAVINGLTYHLDVTFDMTIKDEILRYDYFNLCDTGIKKDHIIVGDVPPCTTTDNDYYSVKSLTINRLSDLDNYIGKALSQGKRHILVKIKNEQYTDDTANRVMSIAQRQFSNRGAGNAMIETSYNSNQMVFEIVFR